MRKRDWIGRTIDSLTGHTKRRTTTKQPTGASRQRGPARTDQGTHNFTVQKAYCTPARAVILQALNTYGVPVSNYKEYVKGGTIRPIAQEATFSVPKQQAVWAEYLMERTRRLAVVGGRIDGRNREWAGRYDGRMPVPWMEDGCGEGRSIR